MMYVGPMVSGALHLGLLALALAPARPEPIISPESGPPVEVALMSLAEYEAAISDAPAVPPAASVVQPPAAELDLAMNVPLPSPAPSRVETVPGVTLTTPPEGEVPDVEPAPPAANSVGADTDAPELALDDGALQDRGVSRSELIPEDRVRIVTAPDAPEQPRGVMDAPVIDTDPDEPPEPEQVAEPTPEPPPATDVAEAEIQERDGVPPMNAPMPRPKPRGSLAAQSSDKDLSASPRSDAGEGEAARNADDDQDRMAELAREVLERAALAASASSEVDDLTPEEEEALRIAEEDARIAAEDARLAAEREAASVLEAEERALDERRAAEEAAAEEARRLAEAELERLREAEEEAAQELAEQRAAEEAAKARAEAEREAAAEEARRLAEAELDRLRAAEAEAARELAEQRAAEEAAAAARAEAEREAAEEEARRLAEAELERQRAAEAEAARQAAEAEAARQAAAAEAAARLAEEQRQMREEAEALRRAEAEAEARRTAFLEQQAAQRAAQERAAQEQQRAAQEQQRIAREQQRLAEEAEAARQYAIRQQQLQQFNAGSNLTQQTDRNLGVGAGAAPAPAADPFMAMLGNAVGGQAQGTGGGRTFSQNVTAQNNAAPLTQGEQQILLNQLARCWRIFGTNIDIATVRVSLTREGLVSGETPLSGSGRAVEIAIRALRECQPFQLPPQKYGSWQQLDIVFDPRRMTIQ